MCFFHLLPVCLLLASVRALTQGAFTLNFPILTADDTDAPATTGSQLWSPVKLDMELDRIFHDVLVMEGVRHGFRPTSHVRHASENATRKVAYLFMVKDGIDQNELWRRYFRLAPSGSYSIYFHQHRPGAEASNRTRHQWATEFGAQFIPTVKSSWCQLAGVEFALLWEALRDPTNAQFVFMSEGSVPAKSPGYVYDYLMRSPDQSKMCLAMPKGALYLFKGEINSQCTYKDILQSAKLSTTMHTANGTRQKHVRGRVRKHHQWLVLARTHAIDVINHGEDAVRRYLSAVTRVYSGSDQDPALLGCADESFVSTALLIASERRGNAQKDSGEELASMGVSMECTTFVYWRHCFRNTFLGGLGGLGSTWKEIKFLSRRFIDDPRRFTREISDPRRSPLKEWNDTPRDFGRTDAQPSKAYLEAVVNSGFLFARKFGKDEHNVLSRDLTEELPGMWAAWDKSFGFRSDQLLRRESGMWPALDIGDDVVINSTAARCPGNITTAGLY